MNGDVAVCGANRIDWGRVEWGI